MLKYLVALLPSKIKIIILRMRGARIGKQCYIGLAIVDAKKIEIGDYVYIGHFNLIWRLKNLVIESGSRLEFGNWITGAGVGSVFIGRNTAIQRFHFMEASSNITIGSNTIIAGRNSHLFTHGISSTNLDVRLPICIGNWCYVGSGSRFAPGANIADYTFVGMGAVIAKSYPERYVLLAGCPANIRKRLSAQDQYFNRTYMPHHHHPPSYRG